MTINKLKDKIWQVTLELKFGNYFGHGQIPLKAPNIEFDFDVSVGSIQMLTDTSKSNLTLDTQLHATGWNHFQLQC